MAVFLQTDIFRRNSALLVAVAESTEVFKPLLTPFENCCVTSLVERADGIEAVVPVFIQQTGEKLLHGHLPCPVHVKVRENGGNIVQKDAVTADDVEVFRTELFRIIVKNVGEAVHSDRCFAGSCNSLYKNVVSWRIADNGILLLLNGCNDFPQN